MLRWHGNLAVGQAMEHESYFYRAAYVSVVSAREFNSSSRCDVLVAMNYNWLFRVTIIHLTYSFSIQVHVMCISILNSLEFEIYDIMRSC